MGWLDRTSRAIALAAILLAGFAGTAQATTNLTAEVAAAINAVRAQHGLATLSGFPTAEQVQRASDHFAATGQMHGLFAESASYYFEQGASDFAEVQSYIEGFGCSADMLVQEWMNSDYHRGLVLTPGATHLAVATTCDGAVARATAQVITAPAIVVQDEPESDQEDPDSGTEGDDSTTGTDATAVQTDATPGSATDDMTASATDDMTASATDDMTASAEGARSSSKVAGRERYRLADRGTTDRDLSPTVDRVNHLSHDRDDAGQNATTSEQMLATQTVRAPAEWSAMYPTAAMLMVGTAAFGLVLLSRRRGR